MQYFVVTHRSIIEAGDEYEAAQLAAASIGRQPNLAFEVSAEGVPSVRVTVSVPKKEPDRAAVVQTAASFEPQSAPATARPDLADVDLRQALRTDRPPDCKRLISWSAASSLATAIVCLLISLAVNHA